MDIYPEIILLVIILTIVIITSSVTIYLYLKLRNSVKNQRVIVQRDRVSYMKLRRGEERRLPTISVQNKTTSIQDISNIQDINPYESPITEKLITYTAPSFNLPEYPPQAPYNEIEEGLLIQTEKEWKEETADRENKITVEAVVEGELTKRVERLEVTVDELLLQISRISSKIKKF